MHLVCFILRNLSRCTVTWTSKSVIYSYCNPRQTQCQLADDYTNLEGICCFLIPARTHYLHFCLNKVGTIFLWNICIQTARCKTKRIVILIFTVMKSWNLTLVNYFLFSRVRKEGHEMSSSTKANDIFALTKSLGVGVYVYLTVGRTRK